MTTHARRIPKRILLVLIGVVALGALMAARHEFSGPWARAGIASVAGVLFGGIIIISVRK